MKKTLLGSLSRMKREDFLGCLVASNTSGKRAFGQDPLVPASIWAGTKGPATSSEIRQPPLEALVPARKRTLVPV
jgi:hypothetical protein